MKIINFNQLDSLFSVASPSSLSICKLNLKYDVGELQKLFRALNIEKHFRTKDNNSQYQGVGVQYSDSENTCYASLQKYPSVQARFPFFTRYNQWGKAIKKIVPVTLPFGLSRGRILCLKSGGKIDEHVDLDNLFRLHFPVFTNSDVRFTAGGVKHTLTAGPHPYLLNSGISHSVENTSPSDRIHLVFDVIPDMAFYNLISFIDRFENQAQKDQWWSIFTTYPKQDDYTCSACCSGGSKHLIFLEPILSPTEVLPKEATKTLCSKCYVDYRKSFSTLFPDADEFQKHLNNNMSRENLVRIPTVSTHETNF